MIVYVCERQRETYESSTCVFAQAHLTDVGIIMCLNHRESGSSWSLIRTQTPSESSGFARSTALITARTGKHTGPVKHM